MTSTSVFRPTDIPPLPDYPYTPQYAYFNGLRYAWVEATSDIFDTHQGCSAPSSSPPPAEPVAIETILCLHGEPTWGYLYRKMIQGWLQDPPAKRQSGPRYIRRRVVVPDLIGFGRSDKPVDDAYYTWDSHRAWLVAFVRRHIEGVATPSSRTVLVVQDWGGILGLILPPLFPTLFTHLLVMNTALGLGNGSPSPGWTDFRKYMASASAHDLAIGRMLGRGRKQMTQEEMDSYDLPFRGPGAEDGRAKAGVRRFPQLVPITPTQAGVAECRAALNYYASLLPHSSSDNNDYAPPPAKAAPPPRLLRPTLRIFVCIGNSDPVFPDKVMDDLSQQAWGQQLGYWRHVIPEGGHFVQEWAAHVPKLADAAWSSEGAAATTAATTTTSDDGQAREATWVAPLRQASAHSSKL